MKLASLVLASLLAVPAAARAEEVLTPPGGPVFVEASHPERERDMQRRNTRQLKQALMQQFDRNGDGRLGPRERMRAVRVLARIQRKLAGRDGGQQHPKKRFIERFDTNGDGNVDRSEMPPGAARRLRRLDRDRDGWVEPRELR